jgi:hypothetical protein
MNGTEWAQVPILIYLACMLLKTGRTIGRGERIRTSGLLVPNQALYQAEPRPEESVERQSIQLHYSTVTV